MAETLEELKLKIERQFKMLSWAEKESDKTLAKNRRAEIEIHRKHVQKKLEIVQQLKYAVQEEMVGSAEESNCRSNQFEAKVLSYDDLIDQLKNVLKATTEKG